MIEGFRINAGETSAEKPREVIAHEVTASKASLNPPPEQADKPPVMKERREASDEPADLGPQGRREILEQLQPDDAYSWMKRHFTDEQIVAAISDQDEFDAMLRSACSSDPEFAFEIMRAVPGIIDTAEKRRIADRAFAIKPQLAYSKFSSVKEAYTQDEARKLIDSALRSDFSPEQSVLFWFGNPDIAGLYQQEEIRDMIKRAAKTAETSPDYANLEPFVTTGVLSADDMKDITLKILKGNSRYVTDIKKFAQFFPENERPILKEALLAGFARKESPLRLSNFYYLDELLSDDDRQKIFRERFAADPEEALQQFDGMMKYLGPDEAKKCVMNAIRTRNSEFFREGWREIVWRKLLSPEETAELWDTLAEVSPTYALDDLDGYLEHVPVENRREAVKAIVDRANPVLACRRIDGWINRVEPDPAQQKELIKEMLLSENSATFLRDYTDSSSTSNVWLKSNFSQEEIRELLDKQIDLGASKVIQELDGLRKFLGSDEALKDTLAGIAEKDPIDLINKFGDVRYLYTAEEARAIISTASSSRRGLSACISNFENWSPTTGEEYGREFLETAGREAPEELLAYINHIAPFVPAGEREGFIMRLARDNPPTAYACIANINRYLSDLKKEDIIHAGLEDKDGIGFAPKTLPDLLGRILKMDKLEDAVPLLLDAREIYLNANILRKSGLETNYKKLVADGKVSQRSEGRALEAFAGLAALEQTGEAGTEEIESLEAAEKLLFERLAKRMDLGREINEEEAERFMAEMGTPAPFLTYYLQYENSPDHKKLLTGMFDAILTGTYDQWKYGPPSEDGLREIKERKLLPESLTLEQYLAWRADDSTELFDSLAADAGSLARTISQMIADNASHLQNQALAEGVGNPSEAVSEIAKSMAKIGQESAAVNRELGALKKNAPPEDDEAAARIVELSSRKIELDAAKETLAWGRKLLRLASLVPQEVAGGYLLEGSDKKQKGEKISGIIEGLRRVVPAEGQFVLDNATALLAQFREQNDAKQNLRCIDSSRPKHMLEIGAKPISSCQHYGHGSHNDCLLGYANPDTKVIVLLNEQGNIVGRSVFRLLEGGDGKAAVHVERIYASTASQSVGKAIFGHALVKCASVEVKAYTSMRPQNVQGVQAENVAPEGFTFDSSDNKLHSHNNRAPKVYVDSAGGARSFGQFTIDELAEIRREGEMQKS